jgi:hypothetical protein
LRHVLSDFRLVLASGGILLAAILVAAFSLLRRPPNPEETERKRRAHLNQIGRICEGQIVELVEQAADTPRTGFGFSHRARVAARNRTLVCYSYSISGVTFQTAQDITSLEERLQVERLASGQPTSIKYDPANPSNSILITEDWSGLR